MRGRPQYPFDPQAVEDFLASVLEKFTAFHGNPNNYPLFMASLTQTAFSLFPFSGTTNYNIMFAPF
jgi:hypothetical protein